MILVAQATDAVGKQDTAGFIFIAVSPSLDRGGLFFIP
jgi:hypothetical protein